MGSMRVKYDEQPALWNGIAGEAWVDQQDLLDRMFKRIEELLVHEVVTFGRARILDVGCGTGSTTIAIARAVGEQGSCIGVDVAEPMVAAAKAQSAWEGSRARFIHADAQSYDFGAAKFDLIVSRFGVMFFDDPVAAFVNLRRAVRDDAELRLVTWRTADENDFMTTGERAAAPLLDRVPVRTDGPGQFAFADQARVRRILAESGWQAIKLHPVDVDCGFPAKDLARYITRLGPVGRALATEDEQTRARVVEGILPAFERYASGDQIRFVAACWLISARADGVSKKPSGA